MPRLLLLFLLLSCFVACSDNRDIRDYYFPARELVNTDGKVYAYKNTGTLPGPDTIYWYYLGVDLDTALYLSVTRYGADLSPQQLAREEITNDGVRMRKLTAFAADSNGISIPTEMEILFDRSFPFYLENPSPAYGYRMRANFTPGSEETTYITLDRRYVADTTISVLGKERSAIVFELAGEVSQRDPEKGDISPTFSGYEIYAKGLGLVEYRRNLGAAGSLGGKLERLITMPEFAGGLLPGGD